MNLDNESIMYSKDDVEIMRTDKGRLFTNFGENYFIISNWGQYGIIDRSGQLQLPFQQTAIQECWFNKNMFIIWNDSIKSMIDMETKTYPISFNAGFTSITELDTNLYLCYKNSHYYFVDIKKDSISPINLDLPIRYYWYPLRAYKKDSNFIISSHEKTVILDPLGSMVTIGSKPINGFNKSKTLYLSIKKDTFFLLDKSGIVLRSFEGTIPYFFSDSIIHYRINKKTFLLNLKNNVTSNTFKRINYINDSLYLVRDFKNRDGITDHNFKVIIPCLYKDIEILNSDSLYFVLSKPRELTIQSLSKRILYKGKASHNGNLNDHYIALYDFKTKTYFLYSVKENKIVIDGYANIDIEYNPHIAELKIKTPRGYWYKTGYYRFKDGQLFIEKDLYKRR